jgi:hypothetical protein
METLTTPYGSFVAYVNRLTEDDRDIFHVSFIDKENKLRIVRMQMGVDNCIFANPGDLPSWIVDLEQQLSDLIIKQALLQYRS